jgi:leucyl aminopeptidase (aminopeptidase T)
VEGVTLWVKDGLIEKWEARRGQEFLDYVFTLPGTRRFGEAAVGTNYDIQRMTRNILFDEKSAAPYTWLSGRVTCKPAVKMNPPCIGT